MAKAMVPPARVSVGDPGRIIVRAPNWLGDLVMATGAMQAILDRWPAATVDLIVRRGHEALPLPRRGCVLPFDEGRASAGAFGAALATAGYDRFYVLPPSFSAAWMAFRSRAPQRLGYRGDFRALLLRSPVARRAPPRTVHLAREFLDLVDPELAGDRYFPRLELPEGWISQRLSGMCRELPRRFVAISPGAVYGPAKAWPVGQFRELALRLLERTGLPVVLVGTREEHALGEQVRDGASGVLNLCGLTNLPELVAVLARAALLVSNDSGAMHVTAALRRPQVAIFGSTAPAWTGPLNPAAAVLSCALPCSPCFARTCRYRHYDCLRKIEVAAVLDASLERLRAPVNADR